MYIFSKNNITRAKMSRAEFAAYPKDYKGKNFNRGSDKSRG